MIVINNSVKTKALRNPTLDYIKAFAILLVVIGHAIQLGSGENVISECLFFDDPLYKFIYSFHMPLFMLISGYLFYFSVCKYSVRSNIINKIKSIFFPLLSWSVLVTFIDLSKSGGKIQIYKLLFFYISELLGNLWFLWAVFWCSIIVLFVHKFLNDNIFVYLGIFALTFITPDRILLDISCYKYMYPYFILGYFFNKYEGKYLFQKRLYKYIILLVSIFYITMLIFYKNDFYIYITGISVISKNIFGQIYIDFYRLLIGLFGSMVIIYLFYMFSNFIKGIFAKILLFIGKRTIGIYAITNLLFIYLVPILTENVSGINYLFSIGESLLAIIISIGIIIIFEHIPLLNKLFLGGR